MEDFLLCVHAVVKTLNFGIGWTMSKDCTKVNPAHAARLFLLIQPIRSLFTDVVVAVTVILAEAPYIIFWINHERRFLVLRSLVSNEAGF